MHLGKIELAGFKGMSETLDIAPLNLLVGPNGSGKSAVLQAIQWAITARTDFGDKLDAVRQLAGPTGCVVRVETSGPRWSRSLAVNHAEGTLSSALSIDGTHGLGARGATEELAQQVGDFAPMFRLSAFLDLSDDKRRDFVMGLCESAQPCESYDIMLGTRISLEFLKLKLGNGTVESTPSAHGDPKDKVAMCEGKLSKTDRRCRYDAMRAIEEAMRGAGPADIMASLAAALDTAKDLAGKHKKLHDHGVAANCKLSDRKSELTVVAKSVEELTEQLAEAVKDRDELSQQIANQDGRQSARDSLTLQLTTLKAREAHLEEDAEENATKHQAINMVDIDTLNAQADELDKRHEEVPSLDDAYSMSSKTKVDVAENAAELVKQGMKVNSFNIKMDVLTRKLTAAKADPWATMITRMERWDADFSGDITPLARGEYLLIIKFARNQCGEDTEDRIREQIAAHQPDIDAATKELDSLTECRNSLAEADSAASQAVGDLSYRRCQIADDNHRLDREAATIRERAITMDHDLERAQQARNSAAKQLEETRTQLVEAERSLNDLDAKGGHVPIATLTEQRDATTNAIAVVEEHIKDKRAYQVLDSELAKCAAAAEADQAMHDVCRTLQKAIKAVREPLMRDLVAPLVDKMNKFLATAAPGHTAYCRLEGETGKVLFELGWTDGERKTTYPAMSGGEQAIYGCALAYALVVLADPPLKLLLIEAGEIDVLNLSLLMDALENISADLSNILVATHHTVLGAAAQAWNVIDRRPVMAEAGV